MNEFLQKGYFGFYNLLYVRTVYLHFRDSNEIHNFFTIVSSISDKEGTQELDEKFGSVTSNINFGIKFHYKELGWLNSTNQSISRKCFFEDENQIVKIGKTELVEKRFLSHQTDNELRKISLAKFNSYIYEYFDIKKVKLYDLILDDQLFSSINSKLDQFGLNLSNIPERVGNFLIEFPNELIDNLERIDGTDLKINWNDRSSTLENQNYILSKLSTSYSSKEIRTLEHSTIVFTERKKQQLFELIDNERNLLLLDGHNCKEFLTVGISAYPQLDQERTFMDGSTSLKISKFNSPSPMGDPLDKIEQSTRIFRKVLKTRQGISELEYKQYGLDNSGKDYADIVTLIKKYGGGGVYIWDPFISAKEIIEIIVKNYNFTSPVKILGSKKIYTSGKEIMDLPENMGGKTNRDYWFEENKDQLEKASNNYGLNLEFRCAAGTKYSNFHDRFLIFPKVGHIKECRVWSLGISLNQFGTEYHVLHEIKCPDYVKTSFNEAWESSNEDKDIVFKSNYT